MNRTKVNIQIWRAFACAIVFMVHFGQRIGLEGTLRTITDFGARGVQLFFIISGYLIANSYLKYGQQHNLQFIKKKLIKLLPLYYIVILYYFIVHSFILQDIPQDPTGYGWLRYIIPLNGILPPTDLYFWDNLGITWTIPYFAFAYLLLPVCLKWVKGYREATILLLLSFAARRMIPFLHGWMYVLDGLPYFCEGIFLYFVCKDHKEHITLIIINMIALCCIITGKINTNTYSYIFMCMILATNNMDVHSPIIKKILSVCDKFSYTLYLAHGIVFIHILDRYDLGAKVESVIAVLGTAVVTYLIYTYMEAPLQKKLDLLINKKNTHI